MDQLLLDHIDQVRRHYVRLQKCLKIMVC